MDMHPQEALVELLHSGSQLPPSELNATLRTIWPQLRAPQRSHDGAALVALFRRAGYVSDGIPQPNTELTVYRGELVNSHESGISWTTDAQVATQYARGYSTVGNTQVVQAVAPPVAVLARFSQEAEAVVDPSLLKEHKKLGYIPHCVLPNFMNG